MNNPSFDEVVQEGIASGAIVENEGSVNDASDESLMLAYADLLDAVKPIEDELKRRALESKQSIQTTKGKVNFRVGSKTVNYEAVGKGLDPSEYMIKKFSKCNWKALVEHIGVAQPVLDKFTTYRDDTASIKLNDV
ncbi:MAG: hypothetical protein ACR2PR_05990 [Pseudohongiellaceae bacterium]